MEALSPSRLRAAAYAALRQSGPMEELRTAFLACLEGTGLPADNLRRRSAWAVYVYYCHLVAACLPDRDARIVDWGGHYGQVTQILRALGFRDAVNYVHFRPAAIEMFQPAHYEPFRTRFGIPTVVGPDPVRLALPDASTDAIISSGVLEHVREDGVGTEAGALRELHRVLKPGGWLFVWNLPTMWGTSELAAIVLRRWHHTWRYWRRSAVRLLTDGGFQVTYVDKHKLLPGGLLDRLGRWWDPVRVLRMDDALSRLFPLSLLARDFALFARKAAS